jgi:AcrR family transcriptional regulator
MSIDPGKHCRGRRRDPSIDGRVIEATNRQLAASGFEALSLAAVAHEAGTTRQALYRRWPSKAALVADAIRAAADPAAVCATLDPYHDLEQELGDFQRAMNLIDPAADLDDAAGLPSGSWYARELAGRPVPRDWAERTAALVWRAVGGGDPDSASGGRLKKPAKAE